MTKKTESLNNFLHSQPEDKDEEMTVTLDLMDGTSVTCAIVTILTVSKQDYIVLLPLNENGENNDGEVWFYRYYENKDDPNEEPVLEYIEEDEEYEIVSDAFDEYLDSTEFDEFMKDE
ncbi:DUF1292 domain-containing protein [Parablautia muri]|uniref:DUF1292 domain-containing protein n=1 Tax=Parablautia muri TaxID=2320879 RepID=A0A9X5BD41_9FIRM|nr:DUF1292 domain-containing protein [Parablautia muri]NBJ91408.1 DUF1292 domain-containing protein [Parablautia muri]